MRYQKLIQLFENIILKIFCAAVLIRNGKIVFSNELIIGFTN